MKQILSLDMAATAEFDLAAEVLDFHEATMREALLIATPEEQPAIQQRLQEILDEKALPPKDTDPRVVVGYLPPAKRAELAHRTGVLFRGLKPKDWPAEQYDQYDDIEREWIRWGLRGHTGMPFDFCTQDVQWKGKTWKVVSDAVLDQYQFNDLLHPLKVLVEKYNRITEEKKRA